MFQEAVAFATMAHEGAVRKGTDIPYITHPLETAVIVSMMTDDEEMLSAAVLHDVMEDAGIEYGTLMNLFGRRVADLVVSESEDKSRTWRERKGATLAYLETAGRDHKILVLGDKLSNIRSTARDYLAVGDRIWERFRVHEKELHAWYYMGILERLGELDCYGVYHEYGRLCELVFRDARFGRPVPEEEG